MDELLAEYELRAIIHPATESHVDRFIHGPESFLQTNVVGTSRCWKRRAHMGTS